jgi:glycine/D-amino acid oxidase-like deaminating enzyme
MRILVVGGGLAGTLASQVLRDQGAEVVGWWNGMHGASQVAAGMFNPVSFRRVVEVWDAAAHLEVALRVYRQIEHATGSTFLYPEVPILRVFPNADYRELWVEKMGEGGGVGRWISLADPVPEGVVAPHGAGWVTGAGWVNVPDLLAAWRALPPERGGVLWEQRSWGSEMGLPQGFDALVDARGAGAREDLRRWEVPLNLNQGEVLTLGPAGWQPTWGLNKNQWILPVGDGHSRVGATYRWDLLENRIHPEVAEGMLQTLDGALSQPLPRKAVVAHQSGLRPVSPDRRPLVGIVHPERPWHWVFNGLGTRGVMVGPRAAQDLATALLNPDAEAPNESSSVEIRRRARDLNPGRWRK